MKKSKQTQLCLLVRFIRRKKEETVNTDTQTAIQSLLEAFLFPGSAAELH